MAVSSPAYGDVLEAHPWRPIRGCPGRFVLPGGPSERPPAALLGVLANEVEVLRGVSQDPVHLVRLSGGGLLSYEKPDGRFIHTLGDTGGLARKLAALGVADPGAPVA